MANYNKNSPWADTRQNNFYLDLLEIRPVPSEPDDFRYVIENQYRHRPDLLAYDVYGSAKLWWVFALRNPNTIQDPVFDMRVGNTIFLPKKDTIVGVIG